MRMQLLKYLLHDMVGLDLIMREEVCIRISKCIKQYYQANVDDHDSNPNLVACKSTVEFLF